MCYTLCNLGWRVQKTFRQGLPRLLLQEGEGGLLLVLQGAISHPSSSPHTVQSIPVSAPSGSINRAVQEQNKDQQLESHSCSHQGPRSCSSGAATSHSSSPTTVLLDKSISSSCSCFLHMAGIWSELVYFQIPSPNSSSSLKNILSQLAALVSYLLLCFLCSPQVSCLTPKQNRVSWLQR